MVNPIQRPQATTAIHNMIDRPPASRRGWRHGSAFPARYALGTQQVKDTHVQSSRADEQYLGVEIAVHQVLGCIRNEQQAARSERNGERAPRERQDPFGDPAYRLACINYPQQAQVDRENRSDYQANGEHMHRFDQREQIFVLANPVGQAAILE